MRRREIDGTLTSVPGVRVGHAAAEEIGSGATVVRFDRAAPTVVAVLGGASATYDTGSLSLDATFGRRWAVFFSGGSVFGLDAARGVRDRLLQEGAGHTVFRHPRRVAPVTGATLFDLPFTDAPLPDYAELGSTATAHASRAPVDQGRTGAGIGTRVGKYLGRKAARPGGVGSAARRLRGLGWVGALAVVNAVGAIRDPETGRWVEGARDRGGRLVPPDPARGPPRTVRSADGGTTLVLVVTDAGVDRPALARIATIASAGIARSVVPVYTATDGDVLFASTTGEGSSLPPDLPYPGAAADRLGYVAEELVARAIVRAVRPPPPR